MASLVIDLQEGFSGDTVKVEVNGVPLFNKTDVDTDYSIGRSDSISVDSVEGSISVTVSVPTANLTDAIVLDADESPYLGIYLEDGEIKYRTSDHAFDYF